MKSADDRAFDDWVRALEARHLAELQFSEVSRALRALSSAYVERRARLREGAALSGAGKRAAFALFYGPLHFLIVQHIVRALEPVVVSRRVVNAVGSGFPPPLALNPGELRRDAPKRQQREGDSRIAPTIVDLGCGTGSAGAAWAAACERPPQVIGIDRHPWAVSEAADTYRHFGLLSRTSRGDIAAVAWPGPPAAVVAAFTLNELSDPQRNAMMQRFIDRSGPVLIVEPLAGRVAPWWNEWRAAFARRGARADEWRFRAELPPIVAKLDRAAGLDHRELTARSLWIARGI